MELMKWLSITDRYTKMYMDKHLSPLGINSSQHMYIIKVCKEPGMTQDQLINYFYIHPSNITRSLAALEKGGFIRKEILPKDKRTSCLYPTEKAYEVYAQIDKLQAAWYDQLLGDFTSDEKVLFAEMMQSIAKKAILNLTPEREI